ncbi:LacI family DNA-binding transcriptional regulator (plasmid) [Rhizobium leguminosarum]|nr:LacI family DNA-binding transcriptional regulator [Rhizobium leguminosarum]
MLVIVIVTPSPSEETIQLSRPKEPELKITIADVARAAGVSPMTVGCRGGCRR